MTDAEQREAARQFYNKWHGKGREDEDARSYWIDILQNVLGVERVTDRVDFEKKVIGPDGNVKRIDIYIPETRVLIEQKSLGIALDKPQSDGLYDQVLLVTAPFEVRVQRNPKAAERNALQSFDPARIDYTVDNDSTPEALQLKIRQLICKLI